MENIVSRGSLLIQGRKKLKNQRTWVTGLGKGRSGAVPVPLPVDCVHAQRACTLIPQAARLTQTNRVSSSYNGKATGYFHRFSTLQGSFPQITPLGSQLPPQAAPEARHGSGPVSLEGTRVIFSTEP